MTEVEALDRLKAIHDRLAWIADAEARAVWVKGLAARGIHEKERDELIQETERLLDRLEGK